MTRAAIDVLLVDNFDSFTHNLAAALEVVVSHACNSASVRTLRPDDVDLEMELRDPPTHLVISPGPGHPTGAEVSHALYRGLRGRVPTLGVCLGHQVIAEALGGTVHEGPEPVHGKAHEIEHDGRSIFREVPSPFTAARYHSLVVDRDWAERTSAIEVLARSTDGVVQAMQVTDEPTWGLQFHPESYLTPHGPAILRSFILDRSSVGR